MTIQVTVFKRSKVFFMVDQEIAGSLRLIGLASLGISIACWALAERSRTSRPVLVLLSAGAALLSALIYFVGVMAASDSGASRLLPRFP
jgi:hypothetical protein